jgi:hypothetical protein
VFRELHAVPGPCKHPKLAKSPENAYLLRERGNELPTLLAAGKLMLGSLWWRLSVITRPARRGIGETVGSTDTSIR